MDVILVYVSHYPASLLLKNIHRGLSIEPASPTCTTVDGITQPKKPIYIGSNLVYLTRYTALLLVYMVEVKLLVVYEHRNP